MQTPKIALVACVLFATRILAADDAAQILKDAEQTYRSLTSYEFKGVTTSETKVGSSVSKSETSFAVAFKPPNEFRLEYDYPSAGAWIRASDGKTVWNERSITKEFSASPVDDQTLLMLDGSPVAQFADVAEGVQNPTLVGSEAISVGGQNYDCYVVQVQRAGATASGSGAPVPVKLWIDKTRHLVLKQVTGSDAGAGSIKSSENQRTLSFTEVVVNGSVPDDLFHLSKSPSKRK